MRLGSGLLVLALAVLAFACKDEEKPVLRRGPEPLNQLSPDGNEIYALASGAAYLVNQYDEQLFYLSEGSAVRVEGVDLRGIDPVIYPLANGAAYLASSDLANLKLYYLVGTTVHLVQEAPMIAGSPEAQVPSREDFLWAQAQAAVSRSRRDPIEPEPPPSDDRY